MASVMDSKTPEQIRTALASAGGNQRIAAAALGVARTTLASYLYRNPQIWGGDEAPAEGAVSHEVRRAATREEAVAELKAQGVDPDSVVITGADYKGWQALTSDKATGDNRIVDLHGVTVKTRPLDDFLLPARSDGWKRTAPAALDATEPKLVALLGDQHAPFHDRALHEAVCGWLEKNQPQEVVLLGDYMDLPQPSQHPVTPEYTAKPGECVQGAYDLMRDYVTCAPHTHFKAIPGNHDVRIRKRQIERTPELFALTRASTPEDPDPPELYGIPHILRMDELGIEYVDPDGNYDHGITWVGDDVAALHGSKTGKESGHGAHKAVDGLTFSVFIGHTHKQAIVSRTLYESYGPKVIWAVECGTLADGTCGLGYAPRAKWQHGFACAHVDPKARAFSPSLAQWADGSLGWMGQRFTP